MVRRRPDRAGRGVRRGARSQRCGQVHAGQGAARARPAVRRHRRGARCARRRGRRPDRLPAAAAQLRPRAAGARRRRRAAGARRHALGRPAARCRQVVAARTRRARPRPRGDRAGRRAGVRRSGRSVSSPAASSSGCSSRRRWRPGPGCCCWTSRWTASTCRTRARSPASSRSICRRDGVAVMMVAHDVNPILGVPRPRRLHRRRGRGRGHAGRGRHERDADAPVRHAGRGAHDVGRPPRRRRPA